MERRSGAKAAAKSACLESRRQRDAARRRQERRGGAIEGGGAREGRGEGEGEGSRTSLWAETHWLGLDGPATNEGPQRKEDKEEEETLLA